MVVDAAVECFTLSFFSFFLFCFSQRKFLFSVFRAKKQKKKKLLLTLGLCNHEHNTAHSYTNIILTMDRDVDNNIYHVLAVCVSLTAQSLAVPAAGHVFSLVVLLEGVACDEPVTR